ncbi:MAG: diacylglycerol/lipid kinase family protein [Flavisolibacter sp.]
MQQQCIAIVNPYCHQGKGWKRWLSVREEVQGRMLVPMKEIILEKGSSLQEVLEPVLSATEQTCIISAGGDGSIHYLVNYLMTLPLTIRETVWVGAIGLGSSNDFLKPFGEKVNGIPVRIHIDQPSIRHDVGLAEYRGGLGATNRKYFIVNASFGVTAEANWNFNHPGRLLQFLKKTTTSGAILCTALETILLHHNNTCTLRYNDKEYQTSVSNINILKIPFVSGSFFYNQPITRNDGRLSVNICSGMSRRELMKVMQKLQKGEFDMPGKTTAAFSTSFLLSSPQPVVFECDGETELADRVAISILPQALNVLKS